MNLLDENIVIRQSEQLRKWGIPFRQVGYDLSSHGTTDENIIPILHKLPQPTLFTHDKDFFKGSLCHADYTLVYLDVKDDQAALFIRRFLKHPAFDTQQKRLGIVVRVGVGDVQFWRKGNPALQAVSWTNI